MFRDVGAPARLTRLVEGEALLNDAAAIVMFVVLLGMIVSGRQPDIVGGAVQFVIAFLGGAVLGALAGRAFLQLIPWTRDDRLAEATLTVALAYLMFIGAERFFHVSGVVAVLTAGLTVSAFGRSRITPDNWSFITDLWAQIAFWAHSLVFVLASILVPRLLLDVQFHDLVLIAVLIAAAFGARLLVLFLLLPLLSLARLTQPISTAYKIAIAWGGLRGALTLVLALAVTENRALMPDVQRFVAVLATGLVLFTLLVNGTTLRAVIHLLRLDRLSPVDQALRDRVLALSYAEIAETIRATGREHEISLSALSSALAPYEAGIAAAKLRGAGEAGLTDHERLAIALVALGNQERMLALEIMAERAASPVTVQALLRNAEALGEGARSGGRVGYKRAAEAALTFPLGFKAAYFLYRRLGVVRFLADRLGDRFEMLLVTRLLIQELAGPHAARSRSIFGERVVELIDAILKERLKRTTAALDALRRQYPQYAAALEARFLRQSALRREMGRYDALFKEGLIATEVYEDLKGQRRGYAGERGPAPFRPRPRYPPADRTPRALRRSQRPAARAGSEAAQAPFRRPARADRAQRRPGGRLLLHRLRCGRSRLSRSPHRARHGRPVRRDGAPHRHDAASRRRRHDLLPASRAAKDRFRPVHAGQSRYPPRHPSDRRLAIVDEPLGRGRRSVLISGGLG